MKLVVSLADQNLSTAASIGIYNISVGLIDALARRDDINQLTAWVNATTPPFASAAERITRVAFDQPIRNTAGRLVWDNWEAYQRAKAAGCDWLFLPKGFVSVVRRCPVGLAIYLHDIISVIYAERYPGSVSRAANAYYHAVYRQAFRTANVIFTNTEFTRREFLTWTEARNLPCPPIVVAGYGFEPPRAPLAKDNQVLLLVRNSPHKRSDLAIDYTRRWQQATGYDGKILCVGSLPPGLTLPDDPAWEFLGRLAPGEIKDRMARSRAVVHFSEYEGFGMPPVEAIMTGAASVYSAIPVAREVMHDCGHGFDNESYESYATAMQDALATSNDTVRIWADTLTRHHHWDQVAGAVIHGLRQAG